MKIAASFLITFFIVATTSISYAAPNGNSPFEAVWKAIEDLQTQISSIELTPGPAGPEGPQGVKGDTGEQGPQGEPGSSASSVRLYDANGQDLGMLIGSQSDSKQFDTLHQLDGHNVVIRWHGAAGNKKADLDISSTNLYFTDSGCTGEVFINHPVDLPQKLLSTIGATKRYFVVNDDSAAERQALSRDDGNGCEPIVNGWEETYLVTVVNLPFSLPPAWPLRIE